MSSTNVYFIRAGRAGREDLSVRTPELAPLNGKTVALFGLGCIGAAIAVELARCGIGALRMLDHDYVDPATTARWPFGLAAAGALKADYLRNFIETNYPTTAVTSSVHRLGGINLGDQADVPSDREVLVTMIESASLIVDATTEEGVQHFLANYARVRWRYRTSAWPAVLEVGVARFSASSQARLRVAGCVTALQSGRHYPSAALTPAG